LLIDIASWFTKEAHKPSFGDNKWEIFWNVSYGCPWTIPREILEIMTSFSSLIT
jgi:hypothetical protein